MSKSSTNGWYSPIYSYKVAQSWANHFWASYPRASELLIDICAKKQVDTRFLAQKSQRGWELWKMAVKAIEETYKMLDSNYFKDYNQFIVYVNQFTIHMLSVLVKYYLDSIKNPFPEEYSWLTYWYKSILQ
jgi:hypothetical protein